MTNDKLIQKLRVIGLNLDELELTHKQKMTGAQNEINQAITRIRFALMALGATVTYSDERTNGNYKREDA